MKLADIVFHPADCCGQHLSATVDLPGGKALGLIKGPDDCYAVAHYQDGALVRREAGVSAEAVEALLGNDRAFERPKRSHTARQRDPARSNRHPRARR